MKTVIFALLVLCYIKVECKECDVSTFNIHPCSGSKEVVISYEPSDTPEEEKHYYLYINKTVTKNTKIIVSLDSDASVALTSKFTCALGDKNFARIFSKDGITFELNVFKIHEGVALTITGLLSEKLPYITSLVINTKEYCSEPLMGYLNDVELKDKEYAVSDAEYERTCGRRKVIDIRLSDSSNVSTKPGDWPWHTAIYKHNNTEKKYICGGTLISKNFVLTAAQCTSIKGISFTAEMLSVSLGKFNLIGDDIGSQEIKVEEIISHEDFQYENLDNDIALLKLKTDIVPSDFIQPACLWGSKFLDITSDRILGTIVGWGFETTDSWTPHLQQIKMPVVSQSTCLKSNPLVYSTVLNSNKFCAGYGVSKGKSRSTLDSETSNCNGDSGSAFQIFVPDNPKDKDNESLLGSWFVRGIVSLTVSRRNSPMCDPEQYIVFTDVEKYRDWIDSHAGNEEF